jgi:hypothetical protein
MSKITCKYEQKYFARPTLLVGLPESSGGRIRSFPVSISFHQGSPCFCITWGMYNKPDGGYSSETYFHHIDMIIIFIKKEEMTDESIEVHNEEPRNLFSSPVS